MCRSRRCLWATWPCRGDRKAPSSPAGCAAIVRGASRLPPRTMTVGGSRCDALNNHLLLQKMGVCGTGTAHAVHTVHTTHQTPETQSRRAPEVCAEKNRRFACTAIFTFSNLSARSAVSYLYLHSAFSVCDRVPQNQHVSRSGTGRDHDQVHRGRTTRRLFL